MRNQLSERSSSFYRSLQSFCCVLLASTDFWVKGKTDGSVFSVSLNVTIDALHVTTIVVVRKVCVVYVRSSHIRRLRLAERSTTLHLRQTSPGQMLRLAAHLCLAAGLVLPGGARGAAVGTPSPSVAGVYQPGYPTSASYQFEQGHLLAGALRARGGPDPEGIPQSRQRTAAEEFPGADPWATMMPQLSEHGLMHFKDIHDYKKDWADALSRHVVGAANNSTTAGWDDQLEAMLDASNVARRRSLQAADNGDGRITDRTDGNPHRNEALSAFIAAAEEGEIATPLFRTAASASSCTDEVATNSGQDGPCVYDCASLQQRYRAASCSKTGPGRPICLRRRASASTGQRFLSRSRCPAATSLSLRSAPATCAQT